MGNEKEKKELKINIKVKPFLLHYEDSRGKRKVTAVSKLEFTTEPDDAEGANAIINYMFFSVPIAGTTIAGMIDPRFEELSTAIAIARDTAFVVGRRRDSLFSNLTTIAATLADKLKKKFGNQYSEITINVSK